MQWRRSLDGGAGGGVGLQDVFEGHYCGDSEGGDGGEDGTKLVSKEFGW